MKKYIAILVTSLMAVSCVDTLILPDDKTVEEDMWKSKSDVQLMVNGAYLAMLDENVISRLIVWGGLRSDEMIPETSIKKIEAEDLVDINLGNIQEDNLFARWAAIYSVINKCNLVLDKAEAVMAEDPSYTQGDYLADRSQMLALRALCYFYLVRNFRDVPYITTSYTNSSQDRNVPQSAPDKVLAGCLADLEEAERNAISASAYQDWRSVGYFTKDGINALQADMYLWRASVTHSISDYERVVAYCDKIIASKNSQHVKGPNIIEDKDYWLADGSEAFADLFIFKNAEESIFELQFEIGVNNNTGITKFFNRYESGSRYSYLYASSIFENGNEVYPLVNNTADWRGLTTVYSGTSNSHSLGDFTGWTIRKYVADGTDGSMNTNGNYNSTLDMNYIIYRLTDVMLMKAEALTALASSDDDELHLREAFNLVQVINTRSKQNEADSLRWDNYNTGINTIENLVLEERLRELAFEGKRWYDLLRFNYRHSEGVDYTTTLFDQKERGVEFVNTNSDMLNFIKRKLAGKGNAVTAKMSTEPTLYMPVPLIDLNICPALRQNPGYNSNADFDKNY